MDARFEVELRDKDVSDETINILQSESIRSKKTFQSLRAEHFDKLLPSVKIGDHAILVNWWECLKKTSQDSCSSSTKPFTTSSSPLLKSVKSPSPSPSPSLSSRERSRSISPLPTSPIHIPDKKEGETLISSGKNIQDLVRIYKANAAERFNKGCSLTKQRRTFQSEESKPALNILLGGMVFDKKKKKGVRRKFLPEPNPTKVEMPKDATIFKVFEKSIELYYKQYPKVSLNDIVLADSGGNPVEIEDMANWKLGDYYSKNQFIPSRHKLYTIVDLSEIDESTSDVENDIEAEIVQLNDGNVNHNQLESESKMTFTEPVIENCISCTRRFRTYIPGTSCLLPDGGIAMYDDPQTLCPLCDDNRYGTFMNYDLFPELIQPGQPIA